MNKEVTIQTIYYNIDHHIIITCMHPYQMNEFISLVLKLAALIIMSVMLK